MGCGSQNKNTTNPAQELYTENASKLFFQFSNACQRRKHKIHLQIYTFIINVIWIKKSFVSCSPNNDDYFLKKDSYVSNIFCQFTITLKKVFTSLLATNISISLLDNFHHYSSNLRQKASSLI